MLYITDLTIAMYIGMPIVIFIGKVIARAIGI
jgi:hypothetical protein